jgi:hypothetical protein
MQEKKVDESGIRTHATEVTGALNQRLRPLGHLAVVRSEAKAKLYLVKNQFIIDVRCHISKVCYSMIPNKILESLRLC